MDARTYYLELYAHAHGDKELPTAPATFILNRTPEQMRAKLPGYNSIAWTIWHIARGEDWSVNVMLCGEEQVLTRSDWNRKMGISELGWGFGMTDDEVVELTANIDLDALGGYFDAVTEETLRFIDTFDFDALNDPLDVESRLALVPEALEPQSDQLRAIVARWPATNRGFLNVMTLQDVEAHFYEATHVLGMIVREQLST